MHRLISRLVPPVVVIALTLVVMIMSGCGGDNNPAPEPTPPVTKVDTFSGVLTLHGGITHPFEVTAVGSISTLLTSLSPDATRPIGVSLGTWNGSICQIVLRNDLSVQGSIVIGQTSTTGQFCVSVYDAAGTVTDPETYVIEVEHQ